jgi:hypothetical protein
MMCQLITCNPVDIAQLTVSQKEARHQLIVTFAIIAVAAVSLTMFALSMHACQNGARPICLMRANTIIWGIIGIPAGLMAVINICALPLLKCKP